MSLPLENYNTSTLTNGSYQSQTLICTNKDTIYFVVLGIEGIYSISGGGTISFVCSLTSSGDFTAMGIDESGTYIIISGGGRSYIIDLSSPTIAAQSISFADGNSINSVNGTIFVESSTTFYGAGGYTTGGNTYSGIFKVTISESSTVDQSLAISGSPDPISVWMTPDVGDGVNYITFDRSTYTFNFVNSSFGGSMGYGTGKDPSKWKDFCIVNNPDDGTINVYIAYSGDTSSHPENGIAYFYTTNVLTPLSEGTEYSNPSSTLEKLGMITFSMQNSIGTVVTSNLRFYILNTPSIASTPPYVYINKVYSSSGGTSIGGDPHVMSYDGKSIIINDEEKHTFIDTNGVTSVPLVVEFDSFFCDTITEKGIIIPPSLLPEINKSISYMWKYYISLGDESVVIDTTSLEILSSSLLLICT